MNWLITSGCRQMGRGAIAVSISLWVGGGINSGRAESQPPSPLSSNQQLSRIIDSPSTTPLQSTVVPQNRSDPSEVAQWVIAGADNLNPGLQLPPPKPERFDPASVSAPPTAGLELQTNFRSDRDNFGQHNQLLEETAQYQLQSGDRLRFKTGFNLFEQHRVESVSNIPLQVGWSKKLGHFNLQAALGADVFDRLSVAPNLNLEVSTPTLRGVTLTGVVEQGAYKFSAQTLENHISAWRLGPNLYWQIDRDTSLFALYRWGSYSDNNIEQQSYTRLERKFGQFAIAANLFTWSYERNEEARRGYFSPPDFLVFSGEVGWQGDVFQWLRCRLVTTLGRQRLKGDFSSANSYQALCTVKVTPTIETDVGYTYSNVRSRDSGGNSYENQAIVGQLRVLF